MHPSPLLTLPARIIVPLSFRASSLISLFPVRLNEPLLLYASQGTSITNAR